LKWPARVKRGAFIELLQLHTSKGKPIAYQHCSQLVCDARGSTSSKALSKVRNQMEATWKRSLKLKPKNKSDLSTDKWLRYAADLEACNEMVLEEANQTVDPHRTASDPTVRAQHERVAALTKHFVGASQQGSVEHQARRLQLGQLMDTVKLPREQRCSLDIEILIRNGHLSKLEAQVGGPSSNRGPS